MAEIYTLAYDDLRGIVAVTDLQLHDVDIVAPSRDGFEQWLHQKESWRPSMHCKLFVDGSDVIRYCTENGISLYVHEAAFFGGVREITIRDQKNVQIELTGLHAIQPNYDNPADAVALTYSREPALFVTKALYHKMNTELRDPESECFKCSSLQVDKTFVYVDVSGFSQHPVGHQLAIINWLAGVSSSAHNRERMPDVYEDLEASICIGDGYIFVFNVPHFAALFAAYVATCIEHLVAMKELIEFHFRMSVHTGPVYRFWDRAKEPSEGRWNYIGRGITDGQRTLESMGKKKDDVVYLSAETRAQIRAAADKTGRKQWIFDATPWLDNRGSRADKHGKMRRLYEVNHTRWIDSGNLQLPHQRRKK